MNVTRTCLAFAIYFAGRRIKRCIRLRLPVTDSQKREWNALEECWFTHGFGSLPRYPRQ
jgi:hypothetical protein